MTNSETTNENPQKIKNIIFIKMIRKNTQRKTNEAEINFRLNPTIIRKDIDILQAQVAYLLKLREKQFDAANYYTRQTIDDKLDALVSTIESKLSSEIANFPTSDDSVIAKIETILKNYGISTGETYYTAEQISELLTAENLYKILNPVGNAELDWDVYAEENPEMGVSSAIIYEYLRNYSYYTQAYIDDVFVKNSDIITYSYVAEDGTPLNIEYTEEDENVIKYTYSLQIDKESGLASKISTTTNSEGNSTNSYKLSIIAGAGITTEDISETEKTDYYIDSDTQKKLTINAGKCLTVEKSEETTAENEEGQATTTATGEHKLNVVCSSTGGIGGGVIYNETDGTYSFDDSNKTGLYLKMNTNTGSGGITADENGLSVNVADPLYIRSDAINLRVRTPLYIEDSSTTTATTYALNLYYSAPITLTGSNLSLSLSDVFYIDADSALNLYYSAPITLGDVNKTKMELNLVIGSTEFNFSINTLYDALLSSDYRYSSDNINNEGKDMEIKIQYLTGDDYNKYLIILLKYETDENEEEETTSTKYTAEVKLKDEDDYTQYELTDIKVVFSNNNKNYTITTTTNEEQGSEKYFNLILTYEGQLTDCKALTLNYSSPLSVSGNNLALNISSPLYTDEDSKNLNLGFSAPLYIDGDALALSVAAPLYIDTTTNPNALALSVAAPLYTDNEDKTFINVNYLLRIYTNSDYNETDDYYYTVTNGNITSDYIITYSVDNDDLYDQMYYIKVYNSNNYAEIGSITFYITEKPESIEEEEGEFCYVSYRPVNSSRGYGFNAFAVFNNNNSNSAFVSFSIIEAPQASAYRIYFQMITSNPTTEEKTNNLILNTMNNNVFQYNSMILRNGLSTYNDQLCVLFDASFAQVKRYTTDEGETYYIITAPD